MIRPMRTCKYIRSVLARGPQGISLATLCTYLPSPSQSRSRDPLHRDCHKIPGIIRAQYLRLAGLTQPLSRPQGLLLITEATDLFWVHCLISTQPEFAYPCCSRETLTRTTLSSSSTILIEHFATHVVNQAIRVGNIMISYKVANLFPNKVRIAVQMFLYHSGFLYRGGYQNCGDTSMLMKLFLH